MRKAPMWKREEGTSLLRTRGCYAPVKTSKGAVLRARKQGEYKSGKQTVPKEPDATGPAQLEVTKIIADFGTLVRLKHVNTVNLRPAAGGEGCRDPGKAGMLHNPPSTTPPYCI